MTNYTWSVNRSGSWGDQTAWSPEGIPTSTDNVSIGVAGITVSVGTGVAARAYTLDVVGSTLAVTGGSLYTYYYATFSGNYAQSAGTYTVGGVDAEFYSNFTMTGGTIHIQSGVAQLNDGGTLAGTFTGLGGLDVVNGNAYVDAGFAATNDNIVVGAQGGKLGFNINFTYSKNFTLLSAGVLSMFGHTLTLAGTSVLDGVTGFGTLNDTGTLTLGGGTLDNGLILNVTKFAKQTASISIGAADAGCKISVGKGATYDMTGNYTIYDGSSVGSISNIGLFEKTFGGLTAIIDPSFTSTGNVAIAIGTLQFDGLVNSLGGAISGAGTLGIGGGQTTLGSKLSLKTTALNQTGGILVLNNALTYGGVWDLQAGVLNLNTAKSILTLNTQADFSGGLITGYGGGIVINGVAQLAGVTIGGPNTLTINGAVDQTSTIVFGNSSNPTANIAQGASWTIENDSGITGYFGFIDNAGSFVDPNGAGDSLIQSQIVSTGTLSVSNSTLTLAGSNALGGTLKGSGLLDLTGSTTLEAGASITVASLEVDGTTVYTAGNLSYGGTLGQTGGTIDLLANTLTLTGTALLDAGTLTDGGTLTTTGRTVLGTYSIGNGADLIIKGAAEQTGQVDLQPYGAGTLTVASTGNYVLDDNLGIVDGTASLGVLDVIGTFTAGGAGTSAIATDVIDSGLMQISDQTLQLSGGGSFTGLVAGAGTLLMAGGAYDFATGFAIAAAGWTLETATTTFQANAAYAGTFSAINSAVLALGTSTLSLTGSAELTNSTLSGAGTSATGGVLLLSGNGTLGTTSVTAGAEINVTGTVEQQSATTLGAANTHFNIAAAGNVMFDESASILGSGTLSVAGTLTAGSDSVSQIGATIVDTGTILANLGTLQVLGAVGGSGMFSIGNTGALQFYNTSTFTAGLTIGFAASGGGGALQIDDPASFAAKIAHFSTGDAIDLPAFLSTASLQFNGSDTAVTIADSNGNSLTLQFTSAQTPSALYIGIDSAHGNVTALLHH